MKIPTRPAPLANGDEFEVINVAAVDPKRDLALLRIAGFELATVEFGNSDEVRPGDDLIIIGAPNELERSVLKGVLSATRDLGGYRVFQTDAAISPGSRGGPIATSTGQVVGIVRPKREDGEQLNFGIPSTTFED